MTRLQFEDEFHAWWRTDGKRVVILLDYYAGRENKFIKESWLKSCISQKTKNLINKPEAVERKLQEQ